MKRWNECLGSVLIRRSASLPPSDHGRLPVLQLLSPSPKWVIQPWHIIIEMLW